MLSCWTEHTFHMFWERLLLISFCNCFSAYHMWMFLGQHLKKIIKRTHIQFVQQVCWRLSLCCVTLHTVTVAHKIYIVLIASNVLHIKQESFISQIYQTAGVVSSVITRIELALPACWVLCVATQQGVFTCLYPCTSSTVNNIELITPPFKMANF